MSNFTKPGAFQSLLRGDWPNNSLLQLAELLA